MHFCHFFLVIRNSPMDTLSESHLWLLSRSFLREAEQCQPRGFESCCVLSIVCAFSLHFSPKLCVHRQMDIQHQAFTMWLLRMYSFQSPTFRIINRKPVVVFFVFVFLISERRKFIALYFRIILHGL